MHGLARCNVYRMVVYPPLRRSGVCYGIQMGGMGDLLTQYSISSDGTGVTDQIMHQKPATAFCTFTHLAAVIATSTLWRLHMLGCIRAEG